VRLALLTGLVALAATTGAVATNGDAAHRVVIRDAKVDGKNVVWWAARARANGDAYRWQKKARVKLQRAMRQRVQVGSYGVAGGMLCIHTHEGAWNDPNAPYWGGMQMDMDFMRAYGGEFLTSMGTADNWPPFVQVAVAMRAYYSGRGFGPWPNTRRMCGI
jgi:hypothetical protein